MSDYQLLVLKKELKTFHENNNFKEFVIIKENESIILIIRYSKGINLNRVFEIIEI